MVPDKREEGFKLFHGFGAVLTLVGTIIGAGILGIPYVFSRAGFLTGLAVMAFVALFFIYMYLNLGEAILRTKGEHQLPGVTERYFGRKGKSFFFIIMLLSTYGSLVAYLLASGRALQNLFSGFFSLSGIFNHPVFYSTVFFIVMSLLILKGINAIMNSEFFITGLLLISILFIFIISFSHIEYSNLSMFDASSVFMPYGAIFFAFMGFTTVPEGIRMMHRKRKAVPIVLVISILIPFIAYLLFSLSTVGIMGTETSELGIHGLENTLGNSMIIIGNLFLLFSITTSFLAIGFAQQNVFVLDYGIPKLISWFISIGVPFLLFLSLTNIMGFVDVLSISGAIFGGMMAFLILIVSYTAKKKGELEPEYSVPLNLPILALMVAVLLLGVISLFL